jgi:photosystem II stability/assembly factor-like uncharacterized protein
MAHDPHDPIVTVVASPNFAQDSTLFATTDYLSVKLGVYALLKSTNAGVTWSFVAGLPNVKEMWTVAFSPAYATDQTIFVAGLGGLYLSTNQGSTWTEASTLSLQNVALSPSFATDNTLFVVTTAMTVYESTNRGQTFTQLAAPPSLSSALNVIAVSPNFDVDNILLLGSATNGIYRSGNAGASWLSVTPTQSAPAVNTLTFSPGFTSDHTVFAGTYGGVLISTNRGASWTASNTGLLDPDVNSVTLSPNYLQDGTMWAATAATPPANGGVFQSVNQGASWTGPIVFNRELSDLTTSHYHNVAAASAAGGITLFLSTFEGMWTAPASSITWQYIDILPTRLVRHVLLSPNYANDQTVFANTYGGGNLWSTNGGGSWVFQNTGMQLPYTDTAAISPNFANDGIAFSSIYAYLEQSTNRGATWQTMFGCCVGDTKGTLTNARGVAISPNFANDQTVLIGTDNDPDPTLPANVTYQGQSYPNQGLFLSTDGGNHWIPTSLGGPPIVTVAISPAFAVDRTAFAGTATKGLYQSIDGGMTWTSVSLPGSSKQIGLVAFATNLVVYVAPITGGLMKSIDGGLTWAVVPRTSNLLIMDIQFSPNYATDQTFFAATLQGGVMKSTNGGTSLVPQSSFPDQFVTAVAISPNFSTDQTVFAAAYHSIYKSRDAGVHWTDTIEPGRIEESRSVNGGGGNTSIGQPPPTISYQGTWSTTTNPSASTNAYMTTTTAQNTAVLNFTGTGVRWVSLTGPRQGTATVTVDGVVQATIDLKTTGTTNNYQQFVWGQQGLACAPHTVTITAQTGSSVTLDAFDVWINACPEAAPNAPQQ